MIPLFLIKVLLAASANQKVIEISKVSIEQSSRSLLVESYRANYDDNHYLVDCFNKSIRIIDGALLQTKVLGQEFQKVKNTRMGDFSYFLRKITLRPSIK